jgi:hypothetical protein
MSIFDKQIFGNLKISKCYELGEGDGAFGIGRPLLIILTDKNYLLINLHAPNKQDDSLNNYDIIKKRIENKINEFLQNNSIEIPEKNIFVVGDFNDRYNGLNKNRDTQNKAYNELSLVLKGKKVPLTFNGEAPKSCCYNWDSSCSDKRKNIYKGNSKAVTCNTTEDIVLAGPDNNIKKRKSMSDEGNLNNYRYTGDYCFGYTPTDILQIYNPENRTVSNESDHELVYAGFEIDSSEQDVVNNVTGGKRKTEKISKRRTRKQKKYSKMYSKKRCHKLMKRCGCKH